MDEEAAPPRGLEWRFSRPADQPGPLTQEGLSLTVGMQDRTGPLQEGDRIMNVLSAVIAPGEVLSTWLSPSNELNEYDILEA
jgi:hypothetical protein